MKCLCVAGFGPSLEQLYSLMIQAGMEPALPASSRSHLDIHSWHKKVTALPEEEQVGNADQWERLARDIFSANSGASLWGWADELSIGLLDFWKEFDPNLNFLLVFTKAEVATAVHLEEHGASSIDFLLESWEYQSRRLLEFGLSNPQRCVMLDFDDIRLDPVSVIEQIVSKWGGALSLPAEIAPKNFPTPNPIAQLIAIHVVQERPKVAELQRQIFAAVTRPATPKMACVLEPNNLIAAYHAFKNSAELQKKAEELKELRERELKDYQQRCDVFLCRQKELEAKINVMQTSLTAEEEKQDILISKLESEQRAFKEHQAKQERLLHILESKLDCSVRENELLLQHLHQTQEDLELQNARYQMFSKEMEGKLQKVEEEGRHVREKNKALSVELDKALSAMERAAKQEQRKVAIIKELEQKLNDRGKENELMLLHLHEVQEELEATLNRIKSQDDAYSREKACLLEQIEVLKQEASQRTERIQELETRCDRYCTEVSSLNAELNLRTKIEETLSSQLAESKMRLDAAVNRNNHQEELINNLNKKVLHLESQLAQHVNAKDELSALLRDRLEENSLILSQLHEAQEEAERLFLSGQEMNARYAEVCNRLTMLQALYPECLVIGGVDVDCSVDGRIRWALRDVEISGNYFRELSFLMVLEHGMVGFIFSREENASHRFLDPERWPAQQAELTLIPLGTPQQVEERSTTLLTLSSNEWERLIALTDFMSLLLEQRIPGLPKELPFHAWRDGLRALKSDLAQFPPVPRFNSLKLKRNQVNPDYEHLWLLFESFCHEGKCWPHFEFRLSCANVRPDSFGEFPKLEFPEQNNAPFNSWFVESQDDFGSKLEIRYALPDSMDLGIWRKLSEADQELLRTIIKYIPYWLQYLKRHHKPYGRPWLDWEQLALNIKRITLLHTEKPKRQAVRVKSGAPKPNRHALKLSS